MDVLAAYREVGSFRGAAEICGTTHKTVRRIVEAHEAASAGQGLPPGRKDRGHNYDSVVELVAERVESSKGRISAKRLLPAATAAGYAVVAAELPPAGRRPKSLVAQGKSAWPEARGLDAG